MAQTGQRFAVALLAALALFSGLQAYVARPLVPGTGNITEVSKTAEPVRDLASDGDLLVFPEGLTEGYCSTVKPPNGPKLRGCSMEAKHLVTVDPGAGMERMEIGQPETVGGIILQDRLVANASIISTARYVDLETGAVTRQHWIDDKGGTSAAARTDAHLVVAHNGSLYADRIGEPVNHRKVPWTPVDEPRSWIEVLAAHEQRALVTYSLDSKDRRAPTNLEVVNLSTGDAEELALPEDAWLGPLGNLESEPAVFNDEHLLVAIRKGQTSVQLLRYDRTTLDLVSSWDLGWMGPVTLTADDDRWLVSVGDEWSGTLAYGFVDEQDVQTTDGVGSAVLVDGRIAYLEDRTAKIATFGITSWTPRLWTMAAIAFLGLSVSVHFGSSYLATRRGNRNCPECGEVLSERVPFCPACGQTIEHLDSQS